MAKTLMEVFSEEQEGGGNPFQSHSETSRAAAENAPAMEAQVEAWFRDYGEGTDQEAMDGTGLSESTCRARRVALMDRGVVRDTGRTRAVRSGRQATVWEYVPPERREAPKRPLRRGSRAGQKVAALVEALRQAKEALEECAHPCGCDWGAGESCLYCLDAKKAHERAAGVLSALEGV